MLDIYNEQRYKIAENLTNARASLNLTRTRFADELGINRTTLYLYESGQRIIPTELLCLIYDKYGITPNQILGVNC